MEIMTDPSGSSAASLVLVTALAASTLLAACDGEGAVATEDRQERVVLAPADQEAIGAPRYREVRDAVLALRLLESRSPDPEVDRAAYAAHQDAVADATSGVVALMLDERFDRDERRMMQRVLRLGTAEDLRDAPVDTDD